MRKVMLLTVVALLSLSLTSCLKGDSWVLSKTIKNGELPSGVSKGNFLQQGFGVAITAEEVFTTSDGGKNWNEKDISTICLGYINVLDQDEFIVASRCSGSYLFTGDESKKITANGTTAYSVQDSNSGWVVADAGRSIYNHDSETADLNNKIKIDGANKLKAVHKLSDTTGYAVDIMGNLYKTADGGETWTQSSISMESIEKPLGSELVTDIKFFGENEIRVITYRKRFIEDGFAWYYYSTVDGGETWSAEEVAVEGLPSGVPYISNDGKTLTITAQRAKGAEADKMYVLSYVGEGA